MSGNFCPLLPSRSISGLKDESAEIVLVPFRARVQQDDFWPRVNSPTVKQMAFEFMTVNYTGCKNGMIAPLF